MIKRLIFLCSLVAFFSATSCAQKFRNKNAITLKKACYWEQDGRTVSNTIKKQNATIERVGGNNFLVINGDKYLSCNLPDKLKSNKVIVSGIVYNQLPTERLAAMPLKLTYAVLVK
jgi:hypothetical protein